MEWIKLSEKEPNRYEEIIVCTDEGKVKSATYFGNGKWSTYCKVVLWQPLPEAPKEFSKKKEEIAVDPPKQKRGRKKKTV